jgi:hypothetical protein
METNSCPHYHSETKYITSKTNRGGREPIRPNIHLNEWCDHDQSPHQKGTFGPLDCHGDISLCPILGDEGH